MKYQIRLKHWSFEIKLKPTMAKYKFISSCQLQRRHQCLPVGYKLHDTVKIGIYSIHRKRHSWADIKEQWHIIPILLLSTRLWNDKFYTVVKRDPGYLYIFCSIFCINWLCPIFSTYKEVCKREEEIFCHCDIHTNMKQLTTCLEVNNTWKPLIYPIHVCHAIHQ